MNSSLYHNNGIYFLIIQKGTQWNIVKEFGSFTTKCILNEELEKMDKLYFTD